MKPVAGALALLSCLLTTSCNASDPQLGSAITEKKHLEADYEKVNVREVYSEGSHQDRVQIKGRITGKVEPGTYVFKGETGKEILLQIEADEVPKKGVILNAPAAIKGEVIKTPNAPLSIDAETIRYVF